jgi:hypothetical protein
MDFGALAVSPAMKETWQAILNSLVISEIGERRSVGAELARQMH